MRLSLVSVIRRLSIFMVIVYGAFLCRGAIVAFALNCHCLYDTSCSADGRCRNGCDRGWYGPGCQFGNLAYKKQASQSSTYLQHSADLAVNGIEPPYGDTTPNECSHTREVYSQPSWWSVTLSETENFVIKNITIVNRQGEAAKFLRLFTILYTTTTSGNPDPNSWNTFTYQASVPSSTWTTFTSDGNTAIGRRVAIYIGSQTEVQMLILCEVYVDGFPYSEAASLQDSRFAVTSNCDSVTVDFDTLPLVPPSFFYIDIKALDGSPVVSPQRFRYPVTGTPSATLPARSNRTYTILVVPETCCIGVLCINNVDEGSINSARCFRGTQSKILVETTPQYEKYTLSLEGNVVKVKALNRYPCTSTDFTISCSTISTDVVSSTYCRSSYCQLNPYFNYECDLRVAFVDAAIHVNSTIFAIGAANFTSLQVSATATCEEIHVELHNVTSGWSVNPSFIVFSKKSVNDKKTMEVRTPFTKSGNYSESFATEDNTEYLVWASPEICWSMTKCTNEFDVACYDRCAVNTGTPEKLVKTKTRQYTLKSSGCCLSVDDVSTEPCSNPGNIQITCTDEWKSMHKSSGVFESDHCGFSGYVNYTCQIVADVNQLAEKSKTFIVNNVNLPECTSKPKQPETAEIVGGVLGGVVFLLIIIIVVIVLRPRIVVIVHRLRTRRQSSCQEVLDEQDTTANTKGLNIYDRSQ